MARRAVFWFVAAAGLVLSAVVLWSGNDRTEAEPDIPVAASPGADAADDRPGVPPEAPPATDPVPTDAEAGSVTRAPGHASPTHLAGFVVDGRGEPLAGVRVRAASIDAADDSESATAVTREDGTFRLDGLTEGPFIVVAGAEGRRSAVLRDVKPGTDDLGIALFAQTGLTGRVVDAENGTPLAAYSLTAYFDGTGEGPPARIAVNKERIVLSKDGTFLLFDLVRGRYRLEVSAAGYLAATAGPYALEDFEQIADLAIPIRAGVRVTGTVVDGVSGQPVRSAQVLQDRPDGRYRTGSYAFSRRDGAFEIECLAPGAGLRVRHERYADCATEPLGMKGERFVEGIVIRLDRGGAIEGRALGENGDPFARGVATALPDRFPDGQDAVSPRTARTDATGSFRIEGLVPGRYAVEVAPARFSGGDERESRRRTLRAEAVVRAGETTRVDLLAHPADGSTVRGRVTRGNEPVAGASVDVVPAGPRAPSTPRRLWDESGNDGTFVVHGVPAGDATLTVHRMTVGASEVGSWPIVVPASGELLFDARLAGGELHGTVVRASDRVPIPNASVSAFAEGTGGVVPSQGGWAWTDGNGHFRILGLEPGSYGVRVDPAWRAHDDSLLDSVAPADRAAVEVGSNDTVTVDFALETGGTAIVRVIAPGGAPMPGAIVRLAPVGERRLRATVWKTATTDGAGLARLRGVEPGRFVAEPADAKYFSQRSEEGVVVAGAETEFRLALVATAEVRVRVLGPDGTLVERAKVWLVERPGTTFGLTADPAQPGVRVGHVVPGDYTVTVNAEGFSPAATEIRIDSAAPREVVVRLADSAAPK